MPDGAYELNAGGTIKQGKYAFFTLNDAELLELRSVEVRSDGVSGPVRETYLVSSTPEQTTTQESPPDSAKAKRPLRKTLTLVRVRIGTKGIEELHEGTISLTLASD